MRREEIKRALRGMKKLEARLRNKAGGPADLLVWNRFFSLRGENPAASYSLDDLCALPKETYQAAVDRYWSFVYYEMYKENGWQEGRAYDGTLLQALDLPADASEAMIKSRFRALAKQHHPDAGGDAAQFIRLMETYRKLTGG